MIESASYSLFKPGSTTMSKPVRLSGRAWEQHREIILALYKTHCLEEVMTYMQKEYGFEASKMAFKKKLGRWGASGKRQRRPKTTQADDARLEPDDNQSSDMEIIRVVRISSPSEPLHSCVSTPGSAEERRQWLVTETASSLKMTKDKVYDFLDMSLGEHDSAEEQAIKDVLTRIWTKHSRSEDLVLAERILSASHLFFGPKSPCYLLQSKNYCERAANLSELSNDIADRFYRTISDLEDNWQSSFFHSLSNVLELQNGVYLAVILRRRNLLSHHKYEAILDSLGGIFHVGQRRPETNLRLCIMKAYTRLASGSEELKTHERELRYLSNVVEDLLRTISRWSPQESAAETDFIHECMVELHELWNWQCRSPKNWLWRLPLITALDKLCTCFLSLSTPTCAYYCAICFVVFEPWDQNLGDQNSAHTLARHLDRMKSSPSLFYQDKLDVLLKQHERNSATARLLLSEDAEVQKLRNAS